MSIYTKSIQVPVSPEDGVRVCVMHKPDVEHDYDIWMRHLGPPKPLLKAYRGGELEWEEFRQAYTEAVLDQQGELLDILTNMAKNHKLTLLCFEDKPHKCHRRLVAEACLARDPELEVVIQD